MSFSEVVEFLDGKTIFITGATGFLAKILIEKILRIQPKVKRIILLLRASHTFNLKKRFQDEVINKDLFKVLRDKLGENFSHFISEKIYLISGDVSVADLGIKEAEVFEKMLREVDVIINSAATTRFDERYDIALGVNTLGAMNVLEFAKRCANLTILLHVSTAYVAGEREGIILEEPFYMGEALNNKFGLEIDAEKKLVDETLSGLKAIDNSNGVEKTTMRNLGIQRARFYGWPNTYVFTKAMGEMLLMNSKNKFPIIIVRPTIITSTCKDPFPGWCEGIRTIDVIFHAFYTGKLECFIGNPNSTVDLIPGDMVVNSMLVAMATDAKRHQTEAKIYHVGSSRRNPLGLCSFPGYFFSYVSTSPYIDGNGVPVLIRKKPLMLSSMTTFRSYMTVRYLLLFKMLQFANVILRGRYERLLAKSDRNFKSAMYRANIYAPYAFFKGIFDDQNTEKLRLMTEESEAEEVINFDPCKINWEDYFLKIHLPGVVKYAL